LLILGQTQISFTSAYTVEVPVLLTHKSSLTYELERL